MLRFRSFSSRRTSSVWGVVSDMLTCVSKDLLICIISFRQGHNSSNIFEDRGRRLCFPLHCACGTEQKRDRGVKGLPLFKVDINLTWNNLDKVMVLLISGTVHWIDSTSPRKAEWLCFSVKSRGNISIWSMNNLDGSSWFLLLLRLCSAFSLSSAPPPSPLPFLTTLLRLVCDA